MQLTVEKIFFRAGSVLRDRRTGIVFRILLTLIFVCLVNRSIKPGQVTALFVKLDLLPLCLAFFCGIVSLYLQMLRWAGVLEYQGYNCGKKDALKTLLWGNLLAFITPGRTGEFFRGFSLDKTRKGASVIAVAVDRFFVLAVTIVFGMIAAVFQIIATGKLPPLIFLAALALIIISLPVVYYLLRIVSSRSRSQKVIRVSGFLNDFISDLVRMRWNRAVLYSLAAQIFLLIQTSLLFSMFGGVAFHSGALVAAQAYAMMVFLPFSIANIGVREYTFGLFLKNVPSFLPEDSIAIVAFGASTMVLLMNIILPALAGLLWGLSDVKRTEVEPGTELEKYLVDEKGN